MSLKVLRPNSDKMFYIISSQIGVLSIKTLEYINGICVMFVNTTYINKGNLHFSPYNMDKQGGISV